jgi:hypothetical protein
MSIYYIESGLKEKYFVQSKIQLKVTILWIMCSQVINPKKNDTCIFKYLLNYVTMKITINVKFGQFNLSKIQ